jgi:hypothetical protein
MRSHRPITPDPLREFLRDRFSPERLRRLARADYDRDGDAIAREFGRNLETGVYRYAGEGNPYECALMQRNDMTPDRPLNELFGAWWLGAFCSDPEHFWLIQNLGASGMGSLLRMVVRGCGELGDDAAAAAHAALPFVGFLRSRTPDVDEEGFGMAIRALEAIESMGTAGANTERYRNFMAAVAERDNA